LRALHWPSCEVHHHQQRDVRDGKLAASQKGPLCQHRVEFTVERLRCAQPELQLRFVPHDAPSLAQPPQHGPMHPRLAHRLLVPSHQWRRPHGASKLMRAGTADVWGVEVVAMLSHALQQLQLHTPLPHLNQSSLRGAPSK
jgi:hypothetical protein